MYFSCLEALQNVAKYAEASTAIVRLAHANGALMFEVSDDGRASTRRPPRHGTGLQGIADRLAALGGTSRSGAPPARHDDHGPPPCEREAPMNQRRLAWTIWAFSVAFLIAWLFVDASTARYIGEYAFAVAALLYSTVGALITSRQSSNRVGLLFAWVGLSASISLLAGSYAFLAQQRDLPFLAASAWVGRVGFTAMFGPLGFLFLIFPTGRPASRRWGWLLRVMLVAYAVTLIGFALTPGSLTAGFAELDTRWRTRSGSLFPGSSRSRPSRRRQASSWSSVRCCR